MRRWIIIAVGVALLAGAGYVVLVAGLFGGIGAITVSSEPPRAPAPRDWDAVFAAPQPLKVTAFVTGWVEAGPEILIDARDPRVPETLRKKIWVPSIAYLVEHPRFGRVLLDAGLKGGDCAYGARPIYWVPCRNSAGSDAVSQLQSLGVSAGDLKAVIVSHFHGDHVSGLSALLEAGAPGVVSTRAEIQGVESVYRRLLGYEASMLERSMQATVVDDAFQEMPIVGHAADYFGDGSLWLIAVPGHTAGQLAALINTTPQPILLTFDASHLMTGFDLGIIPGAVVDAAAAHASLAKLKTLAGTYKQIKIIAGHEPTQWSETKIKAVIGQP